MVWSSLIFFTKYKQAILDKTMILSYDKWEKVQLESLYKITGKAAQQTGFGEQYTGGAIQYEFSNKISELLEQEILRKVEH